jgi:mannose-6-phosphate isomerase-like protein (cupin superfamily)
VSANPITRSTALTVDGEEVAAGPGDIVVIGPDTPHGFTAIGVEPLNMIAIHASDRFVIEWLSE